MLDEKPTWQGEDGQKADLPLGFLTPIIVAPPLSSKTQACFSESWL